MKLSKYYFVLLANLYFTKREKRSIVGDAHMTFETAFTMDSSSIKYGPGATKEVGYDMKKLGTSRILVVTDPNIAESEPVEVALESLRKRRRT